ncbi:unnamed protein product, partial [Effrenium voratum]
MSGRARSRSPRPMNGSEIARLVLTREQARLAKDWAQADEIRSQLGEAGVQLFDKTHQWKCSDGRGGRIPSFDEVEAGVQIDALEAPEKLSQEMRADAPAVDEIKQLITQREHARGSKDFEQADQIRSQLQEMGVELLDKEKLWKCASKGLQGIITGFRNNELSDVEVSTLVVQREKARMANDYELSDMIRDELKSRGVTIEDKRKIWTCTDGRQGPVPSWAQITGEAPPPPRAAIPVAAVSLRSLEDELVSLAVAAARHPDTAQRALLALRQVFSGSAPIGMSAPAMRPSMRPK